VAESVRAGLSDLVERLDQRGFETEVWRPQPGVTAQRSDAGSNSHPESRDGGAFDRGSQHQRGGGEQDSHPRQQRHPAWMEEFDASFAPVSKTTGV